MLNCCRYFTSKLPHCLPLDCFSYKMFRSVPPQFTSFPDGVQNLLASLKEQRSQVHTFLQVIITPLKIRCWYPHSSTTLYSSSVPMPPFFNLFFLFVLPFLTSFGTCYACDADGMCFPYFLLLLRLLFCLLCHAM